MEPQLESYVPLLLKKAIDTNAFISEAAADGLGTICVVCSESKVIS